MLRTSLLCWRSSAHSLLSRPVHSREVQNRHHNATNVRRSVPQMPCSTKTRSARSSLQYRQPETIASELVAVIEQVHLSITLEHMRVAQHICIPVARCDVEERILVVP